MSVKSDSFDGGAGDAITGGVPPTPTPDAGRVITRPKGAHDGDLLSFPPRWEWPLLTKYQDAVVRNADGSWPPRPDVDVAHWLDWPL